MADNPTAPPTGQTYIRGEDGQAYSVDKKDLGKAEQAGAQEVSGQDVAQAKLQQKYGGIGHQIAAGAISAGDALTLGLGTAAAGALGGDSVKDYIRDVEAANPISSGLGTALGLIAPAFFTGGGSLAEEGGGLLARAGEIAGAPTRLLGEAGGMAERATSDLLGGGTLGRVGGGVARGALEGSVYGANSQLSEDVLGNHELTAERLLAGAGRGALLGGVFGGGLSAGGSALEGLGERISGKVEGSSIAATIRKKAEEMQFTATGAKSPEIRRLEAGGLERSEVGRWMLDEMPQFAEDGRAPLTREGILKAANQAADDASPKISAHIDTLDMAGNRPAGEAVIERLRRELIEPLDKKLGMEAVTSRLNTIVDKAEGRIKANPTFRELFDLRKELDDLAYRDRKVLDQSNAMKELRNARGMIEDEIGKQGELAAGPQWKMGYDAAKRQFRMAASVRDAATAADKRIAGNLGVSLSDKIIGAHGLTALAMGNPLAAAGALGAAGLNHLMTHYGDAVGSRLLDKFSNLKAMRDMSFEIGKRTADGTADLFSTGHAGAVEGLVHLATGYDKRKEQVDALAASPQAMQDLATRHIPGNIAPKTSAVMTQRIANAVAYLKRTQPPTVNTGSVLTPQLSKKQGKLAQREWMQKVDVWDNPLSVMRDMKHGHLTPGKADALRNLYPAIFEDMKQSIISTVTTRAAKGHPVPYKTSVQMGILFGAVTDATLAPAFVQSQQALYAQGGHAPESQQSSPLATRAPATNAKLDMSVTKDIGTESQRLEETRGTAA